MGETQYKISEINILTGQVKIIDFGIAKATSMDVLHKKSLVDLDTIDDLKDALTTTQFNIMNHLTSSQAQWYASAAKQQATAAISKMVETVNDVDQMNDQLLTDDKKLSDMIFYMAQESFKHGTNDADTVIAMMNQTAQDTITRAENAVQRAKTLEDKRAALEAAKDNLIQAKLKATEISLQDAKQAEQEVKLLEHKPIDNIEAELAQLDKAPVPAPQR